MCVAIRSFSGRTVTIGGGVLCGVVRLRFCAETASGKQNKQIKENNKMRLKVFVSLNRKLVIIQHQLS